MYACVGYQELWRIIYSFIIVQAEKGGEGAQNVPKGFWLQKFTLLQCKLFSKDSNLKGHSSSRAAKVFQMLSGALL